MSWWLIRPYYTAKIRNKVIFPLSFLKTITVINMASIISWVKDVRTAVSKYKNFDCFRL